MIYFNTHNQKTTPSLSKSYSKLPIILFTYYTQLMFHFLIKLINNIFIIHNMKRGLAK